MAKPKSLEEVRNELGNRNDLYIENIFLKEYKNSKVTFCNCICLFGYCGHKWESRFAYLINGGYCPKCNYKAILEKGAIQTIRPDLVKYFKNEDDSEKYTIGSGKIIELVCPDCKNMKAMKISTFTSHGFYCNFCDDGISIPEKFGLLLFKQLDVQIKTQVQIKKGIRYKYDFLIDDTFIIEAHGVQHYETTNWYTLLEQQQTDSNKLQLALLNGIELNNYIVVDCRESTFEWLKANYTKQLEMCFNLSNVDWLKIWEGCQSSLKVKVWNHWNNKQENETTTTIGALYNLNGRTVSKYLNDGAKIGKCSYDPKVERSKAASKNATKIKLEIQKRVYRYNKNMEFIDEWECSKEAEISTGISHSNIRHCCSGKRKTAGGFIWRYQPIH